MAKQATPLRRSELDDLDHKIIALLQKDDRLSACEVAGRIGSIAERTACNPVANLLQHKHIVVTSIPDPTRVGSDTQADLLIETAPDESKAQALRMVEFDQAGYLSAMTGVYNPGASGMAATNTALHEFV